MKPMRKIGLYLIALSLALIAGSLALYQLAGSFFFLVLATPVLLSLGIGMVVFPGNVEREQEEFSLFHDWERLWTRTQKRWRLLWLLAITAGVGVAMVAFMYWLVATSG